MQRDTQHRTRRLMLALVLGVGTVVGIAACAPGSAGGGVQTPSAGMPPENTATPPTLQGIVEGLVVAAPACPVERADQPCPPKPVPNREVLVETPGGAVVARVVTDQHGKFTVTLPPGTYILKVPPGASPFPIQQKPQQVTVAAGQTVQVQVVLDSGIR